ncbi:MAG: cupin domain-containing protein [Prevotella sp.]|jgi:quercetin dioxygenase-like cupin family protein|nr:cupin domain-containing protein [Prevotella sp.]
MRESKEFILQKDIITEPVGEGVTRQILGYNDELMLVKVFFEKGGVGDMHSHPHVQSSYVESGRFEVTIDGKKQELAKGDGFYVPSGATHGLTCLEKGAVIDAFSPARKDFI